MLYCRLFNKADREKLDEIYNTFTTLGNAYPNGVNIQFVGGLRPAVNNGLVITSGRIRHYAPLYIDFYSSDGTQIYAYLQYSNEYRKSITFTTLAEDKRLTGNDSVFWYCEDITSNYPDFVPLIKQLFGVYEGIDELPKLSGQYDNTLTIEGNKSLNDVSLGMFNSLKASINLVFPNGKTQEFDYPTTNSIDTFVSLKGTYRFNVINPHFIRTTGEYIDLTNWFKPNEYDGIDIVDISDTSIHFYNNNAENIIVDKTSYLSNKNIIVGVFRDSVDIISPSFIVELYTVPTYNYVYIPKFNRYYYITGITNVRNNVWEISCDVDVLMSFKDNILSLSCMISRNEFEFDLNIEDKYAVSEYGVQYNSIVLETNVFTDFRKTTFNDNFYFVLNIITTENLPDKYYDQVAYSIRYEPFLIKPNSQYLSSTGYNAKYLLNAKQVNETLKATVENEFLANSIISLRLYPINFIDSKMNFYDDLPLLPIKLINNTYLVDSRQPSENVSKFKRISNYYSNVYTVYYNYIIPSVLSELSFLDYQPYRKLFIRLPYYGVFKLDERYVNKQINIYIVIDYDTGIATYLLFGDNKLLDEITFKIGIDIGISTSNIQKNNIAEMSLAIKSTARVGTAVGELVGGIATGNIGMVLGGFSGAINAGADAIANSLSIVDEITKSNANGSMNSLYIKNDIEIIDIRHKVVENYGSSEYNHSFGRPLQKPKLLSNVKGFTRCLSVHLNNFPFILEDEKMKLETLLISGVILP